MKYLGVAPNSVRFIRLSGFKQIPSHKSLFHTKNKTGLPIGNYTSQFFANVYLNELDQYVKHELKCQYYMRYVDMVMVGRDRSSLLLYADLIEKFCRSRLNLGMNPNKAGEIRQFRPGRERKGLGAGTGFHRSCLPVFEKEALEKGRRIAVAEQTGRISGFVAERRVSRIVEPADSVGGPVRPHRLPRGPRSWST